MLILCYFLVYTEGLFIKLWVEFCSPPGKTVLTLPFPSKWSVKFGATHVDSL